MFHFPTLTQHTVSFETLSPIFCQRISNINTNKYNIAFYKGDLVSKETVCCVGGKEKHYSKLATVEDSNVSNVSPSSESILTGISLSMILVILWHKDLNIVDGS